jgi:glutamyl-tRNA synthetase
LYAYLTAKHEGGRFVLRIEDTDQGRRVSDALDVIYTTLRETSLHWDEGPDIGGDVGPYIQSERLAIYQTYGRQLIESGHAYRCFCTEERLKQLREAQMTQGEAVGNYDGCCRQLAAEEIAAQLSEHTPYVIRQKMPQQGVSAFEDVVYGRIAIENSVLEDQILLKSDGFPTYNFANVVDDHLMGITHVIRGSEYLSSTPKYNLLYQAFGWEAPVYMHCPPVMKDARQKLSKRNGDASYQDLLAQGYLSAAVVNYLLLLGWSPKGEEEIFTLPEMIEIWSLANLSKSPAIFDPAKLRAINAAHIRGLTEGEFYRIAQPWIDQAVSGSIDRRLLCQNLQPRCEILSDIPARIDFFDRLPDYALDLYTNKKQKTTPESALQALKAIQPLIMAQAEWNRDDLVGALEQLAARLDKKNGWLMYPLGIALAGKTGTPGGGTDLAIIMGKETTSERIRLAIERLENG